jgi:hypothetical protein
MLQNSNLTRQFAKSDGANVGFEDNFRPAVPGRLLSIVIGSARPEAVFRQCLKRPVIHCIVVAHRTVRIYLSAVLDWYVEVADLDGLV